MADRNRAYIATNRGQIVLDPATIQKAGRGSVTLTGGASGSITALTVDGVSIITSAVAFNVSLAQTASDLADEINDTTSDPDYYAYAVGAVCYIVQRVIVAGTLTVVSTATTITTSDTDVSGGAAGDGTLLGYTESGFEVDPGDTYIEDPTEETGSGMGITFFGGGDPLLRVVLKQWDEEVLAARFTDRVTAADRRVNFPGTKTPGDDETSNSVVLEFRPDNPLHESVLARVCVLRNEAQEPIRMRTQEAKKIALEFRCYEDTSIGSGNARYIYRTMAIGPGFGITL